MKRWLKLSQLARTGESGKSGAGYTITEVLIVLAVTTALFFVVTGMFINRQTRVQFTQAVRDYEAYLQSIMSEVTSGFSNTPELGASGNKIFLGKILLTQDNHTNAVTLTGKRTTGAAGDSNVGNDVTTLNEAEPKVEGSPARYNHTYQLKVVRVLNLDDPDDTATYDAFGYLNRLGGGTQAAQSKLIQLYAIPNKSVPVGSLSSLDIENLEVMNGGLLICLMGQNGQRAEVRIGENGSSSTIFSELDTRNEGRCRVV